MDRRLVRIIDVERQHERHPATFHILGRAKRERVRSGDRVKLVFDLRGRSGERMWVKVVECVKAVAYVGTLDNDPLFLPMRHGELVRFGPEHVLDHRAADE